MFQPDGAGVQSDDGGSGRGHPGGGHGLHHGQGRVPHPAGQQPGESAILRAAEGWTL